MFDMPDGYELIEDPDYVLNGSELFLWGSMADDPKRWMSTEHGIGYRLKQYPKFIFIKKIDPFVQMSKEIECQTKLDFSFIGRLIDRLDVSEQHG